MADGQRGRARDGLSFWDYLGAVYVGVVLGLVFFVAAVLFPLTLLANEITWSAPSVTCASYTVKTVGDDVQVYCVNGTTSKLWVTLTGVKHACNTFKASKSNDNLLIVCNP